MGGLGGLNPLLPFITIVTTDQGRHLGGLGGLWIPKDL